MISSICADSLQAKGFSVEQLKMTSYSLAYHVSKSRGTDAGSYVVKLLFLDELDQQERSQVQREVYAFQSLSAHPNLISYHQSFVEDIPNVLSLVMSYAECGTLQSAMKEAKGLRRAHPELVIVSWMCQMLRGLCHLHSHGLVHRDLNPCNAFLSEGRQRVSIGDFGISEFLVRDGPAAYNSPEAMRNEPCSTQSDMWALGCICFELCTLTLPFRAKSLLDLALLVIDSEPDWSTWSASPSPKLRGVVSRLLRKDAADRPCAKELLVESLFAIDGSSEELIGTSAPSPPSLAWASDDRTAITLHEDTEPSGKTLTSTPSTPRFSTSIAPESAVMSDGHFKKVEVAARGSDSSPMKAPRRTLAKGAGSVSCRSSAPAQNFAAATEPVGARALLAARLEQLLDEGCIREVRPSSGWGLSTGEAYVAQDVASESLL